MSFKPKPLLDQVLFVTGATNGVGLALVRMAVKKGARVFMVARDEDELQKIQDVMRVQGYNTAYAVADVAEMDQLQFAADKCITTFERIDTWINNAGISVYGKIEQSDEAEAKRLFDTNFWGVVNGCNIAIPHLRMSGGSIINVGSVLSEKRFPIPGMYSASKFAVKGFTESLRKELKQQKTPVNLTLVRPAAIDSTFTVHSRNQIVEPESVAPVFHPDLVAEIILGCAVKYTQEVTIGAPTGKVKSLVRSIVGLGAAALAFRKFKHA